MKISTYPAFMGCFTCFLLLLAGQTTPARAEMSPLFDCGYMQGTPPAQAVLQLWEQTNQTGQNYMDLLAREKGFNGLYFRAEGWESLRRDAYEYKLGIDLELYDNGRHEGQRTQKKKIVESRIQYLQLLNDMSHRTTDERLYNLHRFRIRLQKEWHKAMLELTNQQLETARSELESGFLRREEFYEYVQRQIESELKYQAIVGEADMALPKAWLGLLNQIEKLQLKPQDYLIKRAYTQDYGLLLQEQFNQRADFHPQWRDDLEARLYLEERYNDYNRRDDLVLGIRVRLPLDKPGHRDELIDLEKESYREQSQAIQLRIRQRVLQYAQWFQQHQAILNGQLKQLILIDQDIRNQQEHARRVIPSLPYTPEKKLRVLHRQRLSLAGEIRQERLQLLQYLIQLADLTRDQDLMALLQNPPSMLRQNLFNENDAGNACTE